MYHRHLVRVTAVEPERVRVASSAGGVDEASVSEWVGTTRPPHADGYLRGFFTSYMDPTQITDRFVSLANEFSSIAEIVNLPNLTNGYRRKAQTVMGVPFGAPYAGQSGSFANATAQQAVILESLAYGHEGGNDLFATFRNPGVANSPLAVSMTGNELVVDLATDANGALSSTAAQVVNAINAHAGAAAALKAFRYRGFVVAGTGIAQATPRSRLSDFLNAPAHVQRAPFQVKMLRIGKQRDGSKVGVFIYCQQHAREWVTPITCLETAERLLRNYAIDPQTKELVDNLDVFIVPTVNPDGSHYSMYDNNNQRRNLANHCLPDTFQDPLARHFVGVDLNRNNTIGTFFDGYTGAAGITPDVPATYNQCTSDLYAGPFEALRGRRSRTSTGSWTRSRTSSSPSTSTPTAATSCGRRARTSAQGRVTLPAPNIGIERYFFDVADMILARIKEHRNTVIEPERTGPIADVLYSAAGNSADDMYYRKGIIAYSFEAGSRIFSVDQQTGVITRTDPGGGGFEGFRPPFETEGRHEAFEFADGNFGLLESALAVRARRHPAGRGPRLRRRDPRAGAADQLPVHVAGRGRRHPLHDGRLDADPGVAEVRGAGPAAPRPDPQPRPAGLPRRQVDRGRHQGQRVARPDAALPDRAARGRERHGERHGAGHAVAVGQSRGLLRHVHAGRREGLRDLDVGQRHLDGGRRDADGLGCGLGEHGQARERALRDAAGAPGERERRRVRADRRLGEPDEAAHVYGSGEQRPR